MTKIIERLKHRFQMVEKAIKGDAPFPLALFSLLPAKAKFFFKKKLIEMATFEHYEEIVGQDSYHAREYIRPGAVVIDAGANVGVFSEFAVSLGATVYAFEPGADAYALLKKKESQFLVPFHKGLGSGRTNAILNVNDRRLTVATLDDSGIPPQENSAREKVEITTIDDFVKQHGIAKVDFIKIDTEGYEDKILRGAAETIKRFHPVIVCSAYHHPEDRKVLPKTVQGIATYKVRVTEKGENFIFA